MIFRFLLDVNCLLRYTKSMKKADLINRVQNTDDIPRLTKKETRLIVDAVFDRISDALIEGDRVFVPHFGTFRPVTRPARSGQHPATGEAIEIQPSTTISFRPAKTLKQDLKEG